MFKRFLVLALALCLVSATYADTACSGACANAGDYTIMIISDSGYDSMLDADGKDKAGGGKFVDETLVNFLLNAGFNVDTSGMGGDYRRVGKNADYTTDEWWAGNDGRLAAIQAADLVIVSRYADSGSYSSTNGTSVAWNQLAVPILSQNGQMCRGKGGLGGSNKWGWNNGGTGVKYQGWLATDMGNVPVSHPAYGVLDTTQLFDFSGNPDNGPIGGMNKREAELPIGDWCPGSTILGYLENDPSVWVSADGGLYNNPEDYDVVAGYEDHPILVYIEAGADLDAFNSDGGPYGYLAADRAYFGIWSYDFQAANFWGQDLTSCYKEIFLNLVCNMAAIPEPATIALLGLGGLALLRKRR